MKSKFPSQSRSNRIFLSRNPGGSLLRGPLALAALLVASAPLLFAQGVPPDSLLRDFQPSGDYLLVVDGKEIPQAEIYRSERAAAFLILTSALPAPVLLVPGSWQVATVHIMKVAKRPDGTVDLLADAILEPQGRFEMDGQEVVFTVEGRRVRLGERPPLLGLQDAAGLKAYSPEYVRGAQEYRPTDQLVSALRAYGKPVRVRVYIGTWCSACKLYVPKILGVEEALHGSRFRFEYYGLPRNFSTDPEAQKAGVRGLPTGVVYVDGKEVGRIVGGSWKIPEMALNNLLMGG